MLELKHVCIQRNDTTIVSINETVAAGDVLTIMGASGSGKSSLLNWIVGQLPEQLSATGSLLLNGKVLDKINTEQRNIGLMFQQPLLFPHMTVAENVLFGMKKQRKRSEVSRLLDSLGLQGFEQRQPDTLSGGQQSRVALVRLLASEPKAVLLDEPFSNLDSETRVKTREFVLSTLHEANIPVILVTHDQQEADAVSGKTVRLQHNVG